MMNDCLFCKIIAKHIPSQVVHEDERTFAFLDINPVNPGHTLVVHKHHHTDIFDTPEEDMKDLIATAKRVASAVMTAMKADGVNIGMNNKAAAGQAVFHAHLHVIPRFSSDGLKHWPHQKQTTEQLKDAQEKIVRAMKG